MTKDVSSGPPNLVHALAKPSLLVRNAGLNLVGHVAPGIAALIAIPILLSRLGEDSFGFLTLVWVFLGTFSLLDLGLSRALTQLISERIASRTEGDIPAIAWTGLVITMVLGLAVALVTAVLAPFLSGSVIRMPAELRDQSRHALYLLAATAPFLLSGASLRGILEARQRFDLVNAVRVPIGLLTFLGPLAILPVSTDLAAVTAVLAIGRIAAWGIQLVFVSRSTPDLDRYGRSIPFDARLVGPLVRSGGWMTVSNVVSPIMIYGDRFVIGAVFSTSLVAYYATPLEIATKLLLIPSAVSTVVFPAFGLLSRDAPRSDRLYRQGLVMTAALMFPPTLLAIVLAEPGLSLWIDPGFAERTYRVLQILAVGSFFNGLAAIPFAQIQGSGRADLTARIHLLEAPAYIVVFSFLVYQWGLEGAAVAWSFRVIADFAVLHWASRRLNPVPSGPQGITTGTSHGYVLRVLAPAGLVLALVAIASSSWPPIATASLAAFCSGSWFGLAWNRMLTTDERTVILAKVSRGIRTAP